MAHRLKIAHRPRLHKYGFGPDEGRKSKGQWEDMMAATAKRRQEEEEDVMGVCWVNMFLLMVCAVKDKVKKWDRVIPYEEKWEVDPSSTKVCLSSPTVLFSSLMPNYLQDSKTSTLLSTPSHSDWINDLLIISNHRIISASSDGSLKLYTFLSFTLLLTPHNN